MAVSILSYDRMILLKEKHAEYVASFEKNKESFEYYATEHFRMSGVYWGLTAMHLLGKLDVMDRDIILGWVLSCQKDDGGFGGSERHDSHLLYTLSAVQILALYGALDRVNSEQILSYVSSLQQQDGSFAGDSWGEIDTRFSYCALSCCSLLGNLQAVNVPRAVSYIVSCQNIDGGFGCTAGNESHAGQVFCCVAALHIAGALDRLDRDLTCWWLGPLSRRERVDLRRLCERQTKSGGLNGRPEKLQDVCYSWWCLSALSILDRLHWIDRDALSNFILECQDEERGGISDRPDDMVDVFHTFFGIAGLSLMGLCDLEPIDPTYALPVNTVQSVLKEQTL